MLLQLVLKGYAIQWAANTNCVVISWDGVQISNENSQKFLMLGPLIIIAFFPWRSKNWRFFSHIFKFKKKSTFLLKVVKLLGSQKFNHQTSSNSHLKWFHLPINTKWINLKWKIEEFCFFGEMHDFPPRNRDIAFASRVCVLKFQKCLDVDLLHTVKCYTMDLSFDLSPFVI